MQRFKKLSEGPGPAGASWESDYSLELRPGHVIARHDSERRMAGGRKGRAASVEVYRELRCSCGGKLNGGGAIGSELEQLPHFESSEEREAFEARQAALRARIIESLGGQA